MPLRLVLAAVLFVGGCAAAPRAPEVPDAERPEWAAAFAAEGGRGTFVLYRPETGRTERLNSERAATRFIPASTFKLYNALVAVETGVVGDVDSSFVWDGVERSVPAWNRDHTLRTGMQVSTVWLYQRVARSVGRARYLEAFAREPYGNGVVGDSVDLFWLDNSLKISADEQVRFVDRLRTGTTGFSDAAEETVRGLVPLLVERAGAHGPVRVFGKTGWGGFDGAPGVRTQLGWIVGWVERAEADGGPAVFAFNVEPDPATGVTLDMGPARLRIAEAILEAERILPPTE